MSLLYLPDEIKYIIFKNLSYQFMFIIGSLNKYFHTFIRNNNNLWLFWITKTTNYNDQNIFDHLSKLNNIINTTKKIFNETLINVKYYPCYLQIDKYYNGLIPLLLNQNKFFEHYIDKYVTRLKLIRFNKFNNKLILMNIIDDNLIFAYIGDGKILILYIDDYDKIVILLEFTYKNYADIFIKMINNNIYFINNARQLCKYDYYEKQIRAFYDREFTSSNIIGICDSYALIYSDDESMLIVINLDNFQTQCVSNLQLINTIDVATLLRGNNLLINKSTLYLLVRINRDHYIICINIFTGIVFRYIYLFKTPAALYVERMTYSNNLLFIILRQSDKIYNIHLSDIIDFLEINEVNCDISLHTTSEMYPINFKNYLRRVYLCNNK